MRGVEVRVEEAKVTPLDIAIWLVKAHQDFKGIFVVVGPGGSSAGFAV